jgi:hypothetical protein
MPIFTSSQFANIAQSRAGSKGIRTIVKEARNFLKTSATTSVFLSHAHTDKDVVEQAVSFFRGFNISVYVDWLDETMSDKPTGVTALKIKSKILSNDKFIFLATNAAVASKWCNWEVGVGDVYKLVNDKICILPLADNSGQWLGNEYLQIYPRIESVTNTTNGIYEGIFRLNYPDGKSVWLDEWLKS